MCVAQVAGAVKYGTVNCDTFPDFCTSEGIRSVTLSNNYCITILDSFNCLLTVM